MKKVKDFLFRIYHVRGLKYIVVTLIAIVFIGFVDENSVWKHMANRQRIGELQDEINMYTEQHQHDQAQVKMLDSDPKLIEKIARERYFMKTDDEDIFVLSDDVRESSIQLSHETAE